MRTDLIALKPCSQTNTPGATGYQFTNLRRRIFSRILPPLSQFSFDFVMKKNLACAEVSSSDSTHLQKIWKSCSRKIFVLTFLGLCAISSAQVYNVTDLSTLGGFFSQATGINDIGQVVGYSDIADHSAVHAFVWTRAHGMLDIHPAGMSQSMGLAINDLGQVAGVAISAGDRPAIHAFVWSHKGVVDLGTLGGASSQAFGINDFGQTVGQADTSNGTSNAFLSKNRAQMRNLGTLGGDSSIALALNDFGQVVGGSLTGERFTPFCGRSPVACRISECLAVAKASQRV